jgi:hypothetical protein
MDRKAQQQFRSFALHLGRDGQAAGVGIRVRDEFGSHSRPIARKKQLVPVEVGITVRPPARLRDRCWCLALPVSGSLG